MDKKIIGIIILFIFGCIAYWVVFPDFLKKESTTNFPKRRNKNLQEEKIETSQPQNNPGMSVSDCEKIRSLLIKGKKKRNFESSDLLHLKDLTESSTFSLEDKKTILKNGEYFYIQSCLKSKTIIDFSLLDYVEQCCDGGKAECETCMGSGKCKECDGTGFLRGGRTMCIPTCRTCKGKKVINCPDCNGTSVRNFSELQTHHKISWNILGKAIAKKFEELKGNGEKTGNTK